MKGSREILRVTLPWLGSGGARNIGKGNSSRSSGTIIPWVGALDVSRGSAAAGLGGEEVRPMTSIRAAGYTSHGKPGTGGEAVEE
jgi:hypothetical protein